MKNSKEITIIIQQVEDRQGEYLAYYTSDFLGATFSVYFRDTIFGSIALHHFSEMLKRRYEKEKVDIVVSDEKIRFKSKSLLEVMTWSRER